MFQIGLLCLALLPGGQSPSRLAVIGRMPDFSLITQESKKLDGRDLKGKVLLVSFVFTTCNGTCPATTHRLSEVHAELKARGLLKNDGVQFLSVTLDPARDTPEVLERYVRLYGLDARHWRFLTGPPEQVNQAIAAWGMWARPAANGQLDHPSRIFLVDRQGRIREVYNLGFLKPAWVADDVQLLLTEKSEEPAVRTQDVIYGRKFGTALTLDVFTPKEHANGAAVIVVVSGGWFSSHDAINAGMADALTKRGYTVFAVVHGSQPRFTIPEAIADLNRAVRFIRYHAGDYHIEPDRIGITGGSAGGHLSLMQGTAGDPGDPKAKDPVERMSSRVQAVACFFPPTDFLNYGAKGKSVLDSVVITKLRLRAPFDFHEFDEERKVFLPITDEQKIEDILRKCSPITHVSSDDPPTLIVHGGRDSLVPLQQSELMVTRLKEVGVPAQLIVKKGADHGWAGMDKDVAIFIDWFDKYLAARK